MVKLYGEDLCLEVQHSPILAFLICVAEYIVYLFTVIL